MPEEKITETQPIVIVKVVEQSGGPHHVYSNHLTVSWTAHDIQIYFNHNSRLPEDSGEEQPTNRLERRAVVTLAWSEAKGLNEVLAGLLARYETANGEIKLPKMP